MAIVGSASKDTVVLSYAKKLANYIEVELNNGKSLHDLKEEFERRNVHPKIVQMALSLAFRDEMWAIHSQDPILGAPKKKQNFFIEYAAYHIIAIICVIVAIIALLRMT